MNSTAKILNSSFCVLRSAFIFSLLLIALPTAAQATRLAAGSGSAVVLDGSSNVKDWQCRGTSVDALMVVPTSPSHLNAVIDRIEDGNIGVWMSNPSAARFDPPDFRLRVPVSTFKCGNRVMESDMRRALKAEANPHVEFAFRGMKGGIRHDVDTGLYHADITGDLSLAGVKRTITLTLAAQRLSPTRFRFRAVLPLRMTDFGVTPPTALFGAVKARDELTVRFDLTLEVQG
ncbi:MAG TPA: YceI family protein [Thermoanaerobaculia bacterium]